MFGEQKAVTNLRLSLEFRAVGSRLSVGMLTHLPSRHTNGEVS